MILVHNLKLLLSLFFIQKDLDLMFDDVLDRNEGFLDHKNLILTKQKNERFSSGVKSWFWSKIWNLLGFFFSKKTLDMTFHDVLEKKEGFLDYKKVIFTYSKNTILVKIWHFFWVCFSLKKTRIWCYQTTFFFLQKRPWCDVWWSRL